MFTTDDVSTGQASFQAIQYPGELTLAAVFPFLNQMSSDLYKQGYFKKLQGRLDAKRFQSQQRQQDANLPPLRPLEQQTHENFEKNCNENTAGVCVIALLDAAPENIHLEQQLGTLRAVQVSISLSLSLAILGGSGGNDTERWRLVMVGCCACVCMVVVGVERDSLEASTLYVGRCRVPQ